MSMNRDTLVAKQYVFSDFGTCSNCNEEIEWWYDPSRKSVPFNPMPSGTSLAVRHTATCTERQ